MIVDTEVEYANTRIDQPTAVVSNPDYQNAIMREYLTVYMSIEF